ncbi:MAG TPA: molybdopterin converting factor subunit 1 [Gammaproteobacteria bacterium]|nr:molybdopterin converting factor subunit 1 [Gammaproteobacteria bacterium]
MHVQVRFFASLREKAGFAERRLEVPAGTTVAEVWAQALPGEPLPDNVLAARNMEYVALDSPVQEGDEVAFFPPVTGGER